MTLPVMYSRIVAMSIFFCLPIPAVLGADELTEFGFGKRDITPTLPMRLSGYSNRTEPATDALEKLQVRSVVMKSAEGQLQAIVSVDLLGLAASHSAELSKRIDAEYKIPRERLVVSCTHTHTGPQMTQPASNLLATPFTDDERKRALEYESRVLDQIVAVVGDGVRDLKPGKLSLGEGKATFAINRRTLVDGKWVMIHNPKGIVDHSLPVLKIEGADGKIRGLIFNYACHATTLGPNDNQYNPDWPGYAAKFLEEEYAGSTVLSLIGCGADTNPEPRASEKVKDAVALSIAHGRAAAAGVKQALAGSMKPIIAAPVCSFGYAGLAFDRPSRDELKSKLEDKNPSIRHHAMNMLDILQRKRRLPETYPLPLQSWQFGNDLSMIFMGGEVVLDYVFRMRKELSNGYVWVTAYANDDPGYIASERVRSEGGYEVDHSMIFYNQPGRWSTGTEELIFKRIKEIRENPGTDRAKEPNEALKTFRLPKGFEIEAVATEPLVMDPVNIAFGADGKLWVVEMVDYPLGVDGKPVGRVVTLEDTDRDGKFDKRNLFLENLPYPNGVFPWRDGVLISAAPEILFARDTNGDGRADEQRPLYSGFGSFNPQHRMNGFAYGLDNRLYLAGGDPSRQIRSELLGEDLKLLGTDFRIEPDTGKIESETGHSQFVRSRDDWGHWFGNDNAHPWFHFVMSERAIARNPHVVYPRSTINAFHSDEPPPVYPSSRLDARFNDLHTANRFTSACSPILFRDESLGAEVSGTGFVCEPVHNLVQQIRLEKDGVTFKASRIPSDEGRDFLSSTDNWSRPVRVLTGPDGALWIADMYRQVIEHPQWIPDEWQTQLDLRAGADRGRIYRVYRSGQRPVSWPQLAKMSNSELVDQLNQSNGALRDMAQQVLIERKAIDVADRLSELIESTSRPEAQVHALWILNSLQKLTLVTLEKALKNPHPQVVVQAIRICSESKYSDVLLRATLASVSGNSNLEVQFELAMALGEIRDEVAGAILAKILIEGHNEPWIRAAVFSSAVPHAQIILRRVMLEISAIDEKQQLLEPLVATIIAASNDGPQLMLELIAKQPVRDDSLWPLAALAELVEGLSRQNSSLTAYVQDRGNSSEELILKLMPWFAKARQIANDSAVSGPDRITAIRVLGRGTNHQADDLELLSSLVSPRHPHEIQTAALESMQKLNVPQVAGLLISNWKQQSPSTQTAIAQTLLSRSAWTKELVAALTDNRINGRDLNAAERQRLAKNSDSEIADQVAKIFASTVTQSRQKVLDDYSSVLKLTGSDARGVEVFKKSCAACHKYRGVGTQIGGNLMSLQDRSTKALLTAILDPNQAVEGKFRSYSVVLKDGRTLTGMIVEESATNIVLATSTGMLQTMLRNEIEEIAGSGLSFMPEGLERDLQPQDIADVVTFLQADQNAPVVQKSTK